MEPQQEQSITQDLALIYIAMAHATDHRLADEEVDAIAERLRKWRDDGSQTVSHALKQALEEYVRDTAEQRVKDAIGAVRDRMPQELRQAIVDDLTAIALSDGRFTHGEGSFIGGLAHAWDVHVSGAAEGRTESAWWSVFDNRAGKDGWTALHHLALVYVALAHETDDDLSTREINAIARKLREWVPGASEDQMLGVVQDVLMTYVQGRDKRLFDEAVEILQGAIPEHQRIALLSDLRYIAEADGVLLEAEQKMIERLAHAWSIPLETD